MPMLINPYAFSAGAPAAYQIARSLRFNYPDSAYLNRTPSATGERRAFTFSAWVKRVAFANHTGLPQFLFTAYSDANNYTAIYYHNTTADTLNALHLVGGVVKIQRRTTAVYRDPGGWAHVCVSFDTRPATPTCAISVNGVVVTSWLVNTTTSVQNDLLFVNASGIVNSIGSFQTTANLFAGYLADVYLIDGQALAASDFGEIDATTGVWTPKAYAGSFGTNGAYLKFADNSNTTAATLGKDSSSNANNFTPNNFSVTAGIGNDSLTDTPTNYGTDTGLGGEVRGNYCTWNPLSVTTPGHFSDGLLRWASASVSSTVCGNMFLKTGKWYFEYHIVSGAGGTNNLVVGVGPSNFNKNSYPWAADGVVYGIANYAASYFDGNGTSSAYTFSYTSGDVIGVALDCDAGTIQFYKNGTAGASKTGTGLAGKSVSIMTGNGGDPNPQVYVNMGQRPFQYQSPGVNRPAATYLAWCTQNMAIAPTPALPAAFTGNASADGPFLWAAGAVNTVTINGNVATRGTDFDGLANGIKLRTTSSSFNTDGTNTITAATYGASVKTSRAQTNP